MLHSTALANFKAINNLPLWFGSQNSGHMGTWNQINAGEMGRAATGWIRWKLLGEPGAEKMFVGADCELCKPPSGVGDDSEEDDRLGANRAIGSAAPPPGTASALLREVARLVGSSG